MTFLQDPVTMPDPDPTLEANLGELHDAVVGHRIVGALRWGEVFAITLDNGKTVCLRDTSDCCAFTDLETFLFNADLVDHMVMGVTATDDYQTWHITADAGDVLKLTVGWSEGSGYYAYGFDIDVIELDA